MLHGAQDRAATSSHLQAREAEEKHYTGALRGGTQGPGECEVSAPNATERLARTLSYIHKTQQEALATLHELHNKLLGPTPPMPSSDPKKTASNAGLFSELHDSLAALHEQAATINALSMLISRAI